MSIESDWQGYGCVYDDSATSSIDAWIGDRTIRYLGTNAGAAEIPFQGWRRFKEAFAPELVAKAIQRSRIPVKRCLDPFGGSGTTALACQFLGVEPVTIEVNPYLADLIEAKLCKYDIESLAKEVGRVVEESKQVLLKPHEVLAGAPKTMVEPGYKNRWVFDCQVAERILALAETIGQVSDPTNRRLMRVILGAQLVELSNVRVSGKGRRYRSGWRERKISPDSVLAKFVDALGVAVRDITIHRNRPTLSHDVRRGDARVLVRDIEQVDSVVFSPPYPNSFDYTDVYNLELWILGYLKTSKDNADLRNGTLTSHVQLKRAYALAPTQSSLLSHVLDMLDSKMNELWNRDIPAMVGGYFADLMGLLSEMRGIVREGGQVHMVVGDSRYAGVTIPVAERSEEVV